MKTIFTLIFCLFSWMTASAQEWAPAGAIWHYTEYYFGPTLITEGFMTIESTGDTMVAGHLCRKLVKGSYPGCMDRPAVEFTYSQDDKVYFYDAPFNTFQVLYDFGANAGDSWTILVKDMFPPDDVDTLIVMVDSATLITINGASLKKLSVTYRFRSEWDPNYNYPGTIIQSVGDLNYMFHWYPQWAMGCDANFSGGLRCYEDSLIGLYETGIADSCDYIKYWTGTGETSKPAILIGPNPAHDFLYVNADHNLPSFYRILDIAGVCRASSALSGNRIPLQGLAPGIYVVELSDHGSSFVSRHKILIR